MKKTHIFLSPILLLFTLSMIFFLTACSTPQPGTAAPPETLSTPTDVTPTNIPPTEPPPPTNTLPAPTDAPTEEIPTETPASEPAPTDTPNETPTEPPSLLQLAYVNISGNIALWSEATQSLTSLTTDGGVIDVLISDDGSTVAYIREISFSEEELWAVNTDGSNPRLLMGVDAFKALDPAALGVAPYQLEWIPDTHILAFNTQQFIEGPGLFLYDDLYFLNADTGELSMQLAPGTGGNFAFSPDGTQYALITSETISLMKTDGTNLRPNILTYPYVLTYSEYNYYAQPVWSTDGTLLRVAIPPQDSLGDPNAPTMLWEIPIFGGTAIQLGQVIAQPFFIDPVIFSPDLTHIAYTRLPDPEDYLSAELVISGFNGGGETIVGTGNLFILGWSLDSQNILFEDNNVGETYMASITGEYDLLITESILAGGVNWVDETRFIFLLEVDRGWQMRLGEIGTEGSTLLLELPGDFPIFHYDN